MRPDAGRSSLTGHCVAMAWFPHEPIDAVTCCIPSSRRSKLGNTGDKGKPHSRTAQKTPSLNHVSDQKWKLHLVSRWIPWTEVQLQENPWQESSILVDDLCGTGGNEMEQRVLARLRKYFQVGSEDWSDVAFVGLRILWTQDSQKGTYIEVSQDKALMSWKTSKWNEARRKTSIALLKCIQCTEALWDRNIGNTTGHSSNVATKFSDALRWQLLQQLVI